nr:hypothetical protein BaRGS_016641 [Batillaria attramentaria]
MTTKRPCLHFYADTVGFTRLLMDIERSGAIKNVDEDLRVLPFEIMVAAQASELTEMLDRLGYVTILKILDVIIIVVIVIIIIIVVIIIIIVVIIWLV